MKKYIIWLTISVLIIVTLIASGCGADIPTSYPQMEFPPTNGQSTSIVIDDIIEIPPSELWHKTIEIPSALEGVRLVGWCVASGGARNDVKVLVLNDVDFHNWRNFSEVEGLYQSEKTTVAEIAAEITASGKYHLVISNWFSEFSSKKVIAKVYLYWSIKPVALEIRADETDSNIVVVKVPASANVTVTSDNSSCTNSLLVQEDEAGASPISVTYNDAGAKFIAPPGGTYVIRCGDSSRTVRAKFDIVPSAPDIGQGLTVDSSTPNAPPRLSRIGDYSVNSGHLLEFVIEAVDPDDDPLFYYACNLPDGASFNGTTRIFNWRPDRTGEYFVHFEASDGVLNDVENITIEVR